MSESRYALIKGRSREEEDQTGFEGYWTNRISSAAVPRRESAQGVVPSLSADHPNFGTRENVTHERIDSVLAAPGYGDLGPRFGNPERCRRQGEEGGRQGQRGQAGDRHPTRREQAASRSAQEADGTLQEHGHR